MAEEQENGKEYDGKQQDDYHCQGGQGGLARLTGLRETEWYGSLALHLLLASGRAFRGRRHRPGAK
jgi:hypothetical protein